MNGKEVRRIIKNWIISGAVLAAAWLICSAIRRAAVTDDYYVPLVFVLAVLVISLLTDGYFYGILASLVSVLGVNWAFTYPYMELDFSIYGYPTTFITMLAVSVVISALTTRVQEQEKLKHETEQAELRANLLRAISHDLRTPLTSIIGSIGTVLAEDEILTPGQRTELLSDARNDAEWLVRMVENILSITRISGSEKQNISKSPELVEEIVASCVSSFRKRSTGVELHASVPDDPVTVTVDPMLIKQVIMNLLDNSVYHGACVTEIRLDAFRDSKNIRIRISDNGVGIDPSIIDDLFKGQLSPNDSNKFRGIGLAVCKTIVTAHGGTISGCNAPDGGAVFEFTLPLEDEEYEYQG